MSDPSALPPHRPSSDRDLADPIAAIVQNGKGQRRRENFPSVETEWCFRRAQECAADQPVHGGRHA